MQLYTDIDAVKRYAYIKVTGRITTGVFRDAIMTTFMREDSDPTFAQLIDLSGLEGFPVTADAQDAHSVFRVMRHILKGKIAVLAPNDTVNTIVKLVSAYAAKEGLALESFTQEDSAKKWLGVA